MSTDTQTPRKVEHADEATFEQQVLRSDIPVLVDFYADWCGPCRALAPTLEELAQELPDAKIVKVNVDENQQISAQMRIQSIPTVYAFFQGQPVDGFQGARPPSQVTEFVNKVAALAGDGGLADAIEREGEAGWPHPGARIRLLDAEGHEVAPGETGEVCVQADNLMRGYWRPDGRAGDGLQDGWFHTGDLGRLAPDGCLCIVGRAKDMIISGGENIYPAEIENLLLSLSGVLECAVVGVPDERWGETPVAAIVAEPDSGLNAETVLAHLQARMARFKLPRRLVFVDALPKSALGKVQKARLRTDDAR